MLNQADVDYFNRGIIENPRFWSRFPSILSFKNMRVLDVGCGHGSMCIFLAKAEAKNVVGIDLDSERISFAKENLSIIYPELSQTVEFRDVNIDQLENETFDIVVSKDSFEHIMDLPNIMGHIRRVLKKGGRLYTGFAPLYRTFNGDHGRTKSIIPWGHLIIPERILLKRLNKKSIHRVDSICDLGLNKLSLKEYKKIFNESGLKVIYFKTNESKNILAKLFKIVSKIPFLEEFFTYHLHAILEKND